MFYMLLKIVISAVLIAAISEAGKRSSTLGAVLASIPLVSVLAMVWLYYDTRDPAKVGALALDIFWLVIPSLLLFLLLPLLLKHGTPFWLALPLSAAATVGGYFLTIFLMQRLSHGA